MWHGEQMELVYVFLLQFLKDMQTRGVSISCVAYDNACKLWKTVQLFTNWVGSGPLPQAQSYVVLEESSPNPDTPQDAALLQNKNTEACEQLNSWITGRTKSSLDALPFIGAPCSSSTMFGWRQRLTACGDDLPKARCSMILTRLAVGKICYAIITRDFFVLAVCSSHVSYLVIPSENRCSPCQILMHFQG